MAELEKHYRQLFLQYGDSPEANQWSNEETQVKRFKVLAEVGDLGGSKILDFGCGTAHLATYLKQRDIKVTYTGVDLVEEMLDCAKKKHPEHTFCSLQEALESTYDYAFISGTFNNIRVDNKAFYRDIIKTLYPKVSKGLAFNMMSVYVDYYDNHLFYEKPEEAFSFIKKEISPFVVLRSDYQVKPGVIPFEFTMYVYRTPQGRPS